MLAGLLASTLPGTRLPVLMAVALIGAGGLAKASWKLIWVLSQLDHAWLANLLFILMAPGMVILAFHVAAATPAWRTTTAGASPAAGSQALHRSLVVIGLAWGLALVSAYTQTEGKTWFFILLATASFANITISTLLIRVAWRLNQHLTSGLFLLSILLILSLSGLARVSEGSAPLQWLAECLNTLAHGSFALAVWRLRRVIPSAATQL